MESRTEVDPKRSSGFNLPSGERDPVPTALDTSMWASAATGTLVVQRCRACQAHRYPPTRACYRCRHKAWSWESLPGTGIIATFTWVLDAPRTEIAESPCYYNVAVITLDGTTGDPVRIVSNVVDAWKPGEIEVGLPVELVTLSLGEGIGLPLFRRSTRGGSS